jgi:hypothetical protein
MDICIPTSKAKVELRNKCPSDTSVSEPEQIGYETESRGDTGLG